MTMLLWDKLCKENDLKYLLKRGNLDNRAIQVHNAISDQIINTFGIPEKYLRILKLKLQIEQLWSDILIKGEKFKELHVNIKEKELEGLEGKGENKQQNIYKSFFILEKNLGFKIDYEKITIAEYYNYQNCIIEQQNELKKNEKAKPNNR